MLIDRTHRVWIMFTAIALLISAVGYVIYAALSVRGPSGGSVVGLIYGSVGSAMMLFAGLLGARKKLPVWRLGRGTTWMRGHLWLGFLSFPLILFHGGFRLGSGPLTRTLMVLFIVVFVSGIVGAVLQHFVPKMMIDQVPMETIYEQIDRIRLQLLEEADNIAAELKSALEGDLAQAGAVQRAVAAAAGTRGGLTYASGLGATDRASNAIREFHEKELRPFLSQAGGRGRALADATQVEPMFAQLRVLVPHNFWPKLQDLENISEEKRQIDRQRRLHQVLHGWLIVHVPASYALLLLGAIHAVVALRY